MENPHFSDIHLKLEEVRGHLEKMGRSLLDPVRTAGSSAFAAIAGSSNGIVAHDWQPTFNAEFNSFVVKTKSIPDLILNRFGFDLYKRHQGAWTEFINSIFSLIGIRRNEPKNDWLQQLDDSEQQRRRQFQKKFRKKTRQFDKMPLSDERHETIHRSGVGRWRVDFNGLYGEHSGNPRQPVAHVESPPIVPDAPADFAWLTAQNMIPIRPTASNFTLEIVGPNGTNDRRPLFDECQSYLKEAELLIEVAKQLFQEIHGTNQFTARPN
jgi:hypothetical protein